MRYLAEAIRSLFVNVWLSTFGRRGVQRWADATLADVLTRPKPSVELNDALRRARAIAAIESGDEMSTSHVLQALEHPATELFSPVPHSIQYAPGLRLVLAAAARLAASRGHEEIALQDFEFELRASLPRS